MRTGMKTYRFRFPYSLSADKERFLYGGLSAFFYQVEDSIKRGADGADNGLNKLVSRATAKVTNMDGAQSVVARLRMAKDHMPNLIGWELKPGGYYEFWFNKEYFNRLMNIMPMVPEQLQPNFGNKLDRRFREQFRNKICPKMGFMCSEVSISEVNEDGTETETTF